MKMISLRQLLDDDFIEALASPVAAIGWPGLMPVQAEGIPYILEGRDLIVQSRTGSGKTGAFLLPLLEQLDRQSDGTQALVLCPTRELALQIHGEFEKMTADMPADERVRAVPVYGGTAYGPQIDAFKNGVELVIGTPGRVLDHLERRSLRLDTLRALILDEADEMLSMGFYPDMRKLKRFLPRERTSARARGRADAQVRGSASERACECASTRACGPAGAHPCT